MIINITDRLAFGDEAVCTSDVSGAIAVVHACKEPCHRNAVGYDTKAIAKSHPNYFALQRKYHLYLNLIDPPVPLFMIESFHAFFGFVDYQIPDRPVLIHCNQGQSRAPSLALLYASKRLGIFPADTFADAAAAFRTRYNYEPGAGIASWLTGHWSDL